ncbi:hypothetical protein LAZ67_1002038 [Cordylochernes scorpioides]|uniref:CCHC-type domain-containing protein n=1 Tax=Cordylochernes scorpioides TaxID=51811 RepID=A0ABY6JYM3_9ARAC|nr:hypothetical protein LAZ67_1002038 [Cordylochernes scorpioides]
MKGRRYATLDEIKTASKEELKKIFKNDFLKCFEDWKNRWHKCIISHGDYFEGGKIDIRLGRSSNDKSPYLNTSVKKRLVNVSLNNETIKIVVVVVVSKEESQMSPCISIHHSSSNIHYLVLHWKMGAVATLVTLEKNQNLVEYSKSPVGTAGSRRTYCAIRHYLTVRHFALSLPNVNIVLSNTIKFDIECKQKNLRYLILTTILTSERNQSESDIDCDEIISDLSDTSDTQIYSYHDTDSEHKSEADEELPNDDSEFYFGKDGVTKWKKTMWQKTQNRTRSENIISQLPGPKSEAKSIESESDAFTKIIDNDMDHLKIRSQMKNLPRSLRDLIILHCKKAESPEPNASNYGLSVAQKAELLLEDAFKGASYSRPQPTESAPSPSTSFASVAAVEAKPGMTAPPITKSKPAFVNLAPSFKSHVVVRSVDPKANPRDILKEIQKADPSLTTSKDMVASINSSGKVVLHTSTDEVAKNLASKLATLPSSLSCHERPTILPRYCLFSVDNNVSDEEICTGLSSNHAIQSLPGLRSIKVVHRSGNNARDAATVFVEVDNKVAEILGQQGRIPIAGLMHRFERSHSLKQCFRCCGFGHRAPYCTAAHPTCYKCGSTEHEGKQCAVEASQARCCRCSKKAGAAINHLATSSLCPFVKAKIAQSKNHV